MSIAPCPSTRFADAADERLVANLTALWGRDPALAACVEAAADDGRIVTSIARSGEPTACVVTAAGATVQLHSKYEPAAEAVKLVERLADAESPAYFVLGFGLGHHVEALLRRVPESARVWVIEPDAGVIRAAIACRDLTALFDNDNVRFIGRIDRPTLLGDFQSTTALIHAGVTIVEHPPSVRLDAAFYDDARAWIDELRSYARTAIHTLVLNSGRTIANIARNLPWYAASPGPQRLANAFRGEPAIIVSAGPSLRKNQHLLREAKGKAVIIAVQTTLKPLLELGVEPDFVTSLDYSEISTRFFRDLPGTLKTELVAEAKATDALFELHPGPLTLVGNDLADAMTRESARPRTRLRAGATVAHLAFYLAEHLGCDPIIFVGQDLGFSDGLCYAPGTSYDDVWRPELGRFCSIEMKQWEQIARDRPILRQVPDQQGRPMYTEHRLFTYLQQFERDFATTKSRVIDASEGGALKRGTGQMTLRAALDAFCRRPLAGRVPPHPGLDVSSIGPTREAIGARIAEADAMRAIAGDVIPLLEEIRDHVGDHARVNRAIARLDPLREAMNRFGRTYDLVMYLTQQTEFDRFKADLAMAGVAGDVDRLQRRQTRRDLENARAVAAACEKFVGLMRDSLAAFDAFREPRGVAA